MQLQRASEAEYSFEQDFYRQALPEGGFFSLDLRGAAVRPSPLVPLVSSSSSPTLSFFLSRGDTYLCFARPSSLLPLIASDHQGKERTLSFLLFPLEAGVLWLNKKFLGRVLPSLIATCYPSSCWCKHAQILLL